MFCKNEKYLPHGFISIFHHIHCQFVCGWFRVRGLKFRIKTTANSIAFRVVSTPDSWQLAPLKELFQGRVAIFISW